MEVANSCILWMSGWVNSFKYGYSVVIRYKRLLSVSSEVI